MCISSSCLSAFILLPALQSSSSVTGLQALRLLIDRLVLSLGPQCLRQDHRQPWHNGLFSSVPVVVKDQLFVLKLGRCYPSFTLRLCIGCYGTRGTMGWNVVNITSPLACMAHCLVKVHTVCSSELNVLHSFSPISEYHFTGIYYPQVSAAIRVSQISRRWWHWMVLMETVASCWLRWL